MPYAKYAIFKIELNKYKTEAHLKGFVCILVTCVLYSILCI